MKNLYALLFASVVVAISASYFFDGYKARLIYGNNLAANPDKAYDRMNKTAVLRCGYTLSEPALMRDPETGLLSGIFYDYMTLVEDALSVDVQWTVEIHPDQKEQIFGNSHYDIECSGAFSKLGQVYDVSYVRPLYYQKNENTETIQAISIALPSYELRLNDMLSRITEEMINNDQVDAIIESHDGLNYDIKTPNRSFVQ